MFLLSGLPHVFQQRTLFSPNLLHVGNPSTGTSTGRAELISGRTRGKRAERLFAGEHFGRRLKIVFIHLGTSEYQGLWA